MFLLLLRASILQRVFNGQFKVRIAEPFDVVIKNLLRPDLLFQFHGIVIGGNDDREIFSEASKDGHKFLNGDQAATDVHDDEVDVLLFYEGYRFRGSRCPGAGPSPRRRCP